MKKVQHATYTQCKPNSTCIMKITNHMARILKSAGTDLEFHLVFTDLMPTNDNITNDDVITNEISHWGVQTKCTPKGLWREHSSSVSFYQSHNCEVKGFISYFSDFFDSCKVDIDYFNFLKIFSLLILFSTSTRISLL